MSDLGGTDWVRDTNGGFWIVLEFEWLAYCFGQWNYYFGTLASTIFNSQSNPLNCYQRI